MASYEERTTTTTSSSEGIGFDRGYLTHYLGILKIVEIVLDLIGFICASVWIHWGAYGGGWVQFVTMSAFITTLLLFLFHVTRVIYKLPGPWGLIEFIYYCVYSLMMLIAAIVCASRGHWHSSIGAAALVVYHMSICVLLLVTACVCASYGDWHSSIGFAAFFTFAATAVYIVDTFFNYRNWQSARSSSGAASSQTTTTTTTTKETYETRVQY